MSEGSSPTLTPALICVTCKDSIHYNDVMWCVHGYGLPSPDDCISSSVTGNVIGVAAVVGRADVVDRADVFDGARAVVMGGAVVVGGPSVPGLLQSGPMNPGTQFTTKLTINANPAIAVPGVTTTVPGAPFIALVPVYVLNITVSSTSEFTSFLTVTSRPTPLNLISPPMMTVGNGPGMVSAPSPRASSSGGVSTALTSSS